MLNISIIVLFSFILVYSNIIILNEETLILICFFAFCLIAFNKLKDSISKDFQMNSYKVEISLYKSFIELVNSLKSVFIYKYTFKNIVLNLQSLKIHFVTFGIITCKELPEYIIRNTEITYPKKLMFTQRLENQTSKLLALLLNYKLTRITNIQNFYTHNCEIEIFLCVQKIILREYLKVL
uniref:ATP synthase F0 subunit b n=1 Tax=Hypnea nidifica TaxID=673448 RepID=UPI0030011785|nr:ATP synthase F0 subunit b [Hypnea nidifica]